MDMRATAKLLVSKLPKSVIYEVFYQSATALGIEAYRVSGQTGTYTGLLRDQAIIKKYMFDGAWSTNIIDLFSEFFGNGGGTFLDIGANIGMISIPISKLTEVYVTGFEPDPRLCTLLRANVAAAGANVELIQAAVAAEAGNMSFNEGDYNPGDGRLVLDGSGQCVPTIRLDDHAVRPGRLAVKIDTQGAEPLIVAGGRRTLSGAGLVVMEFWPWGMQRMGTDANTVIDFAGDHFSRGNVMRHEDKPGAMKPIKSVINELNSLVNRGGEYNAVDLVLMP